MGQVEFLEQELSESQDMGGRFVFGYVPPEPHNSPATDCLGSHEAIHLHQLVRERRVTACFFGHRHAKTLYLVGSTAIYGVPSTNWNFGGAPVGFFEAVVYPDEVRVSFVAT